MSGYDDRRMKELADRLVAMSPEPPPFPEEVTVTQPRTSRPSPILMFAGAAVVVLILAAIPILLFARGGGVSPLATTTTSILPSTETSQPAVTSTTLAEATTTTKSEGTTTTITTESRGVIVFLVQSPENSNTGNPAVVPLFAATQAPPDDPDVLAALRLLTNDDLVPPSGFDTTIPEAVEVVGVDTSDNHIMVVDMNQAFVEGAGGALADFTMLNQLIFTASGFGEVEAVQFTVGGEPVTEFGSEALDISDPVGRDAFIDQLNSVIVDSAATGSGSSPLVITGTANVFEATVSLELVDLDGNVVYEDVTTATCGTGCWGFYSFNIDGFDFESTPVTLRVFWHSPEDGEPSDVVSIPVSWGEDAIWDLLP